MNKNNISLVVGIAFGIIAGVFVTFVSFLGGMAAQSNSEANAMAMQGLITGLIFGCAVSVILTNAIRKKYNVWFYLGIAVVSLLILFVWGF